jgi:hypothetical protein
MIAPKFKAVITISFFMIVIFNCYFYLIVLFCILQIYSSDKSFFVVEKGSSCSKITTGLLIGLNRKTLNTWKVLRAYIIDVFFL